MNIMNTARVGTNCRHINATYHGCTTQKTPPKTIAEQAKLIVRDRSEEMRIDSDVFYDR